MNTRSIHYTSGLIIAVFVGLHLFNHVCGIWGAEKHIAVMEALRVVYRNILAETILLGAVAVQIFSGLKLFRARRKLALSGFDKLHIWSGLYLAVFFLVHVSAILVGRLYLHLDTNFYFGSAGINTFPFSLFFYPYYTLAIFSFFGHIASVHRKKMRANILGLTPKGQSVAIILAGICLTVLIFYAMTDRFRGVTVPAEYGVLIGK